MTGENESLIVASLTGVSVPFAVPVKHGVIVAVERCFRLRQAQSEDVERLIDSRQAMVSTYELPTPVLLTIAEASTKFRLSEETIRRLVAQGVIRAIKDKKPLRVYEYSISEYLAGL